MSEENLELEQLKAEAETLGITCGPNIGVDTLKKRIADALVSGSTEDEEPEVVVPKKKSFKQIKDAATKMVRVQLTCMNPAKSSWLGETFKVSNKYVKEHRYVPFNAPNGWHVPRIVLNYIQDRKCNQYYTEVINGTKVRKMRIMNEFSVIELPPLTAKELEELKKLQIANQSID